MDKTPRRFHALRTRAWCWHSASRTLPIIPGTVSLILLVSLCSFAARAQTIERIDIRGPSANAPLHDSLGLQIAEGSRSGGS